MPGILNLVTDGAEGAPVIPVSLIKDYDFCPRALYLRHVLNKSSPLDKERVSSFVLGFVRKELALRRAVCLRSADSDSVDADDEDCLMDFFENLFLNEVYKIAGEIPVIYRERFEEFEKAGLAGFDVSKDEIASRMGDDIKLLSGKLASIACQIGIDATVERFSPWKTDFYVRSDGLGLAARVDMIMGDESSMAPVEIKTGNVKEGFTGVWEADRLKVASYSMLVEERFNCHIKHGFVEYARVFERVPVLITESVRRRVLGARDDILKIISGEIPGVCPHGNKNKCKGCDLAEICGGI